MNLEEMVPEEWKESVRGIKITIDCINWIAFLGGAGFWLGLPVGFLSGATAQGIRLFLIDP